MVDTIRQFELVTVPAPGTIYFDSLECFAYNYFMKTQNKDLNLSGIYQILNLVTNKRYIGQAENIQARIHEHKRKRNKGYLYRSINKYGWDNFEISVLERVDDISKLDEREQFWLDHFKSYMPLSGYNICKIAGTTRGRKRPKKELLGIIKYRKSCIKEKNHFFGKKHNDKTKRKISKARKRIGTPWGRKVYEARVRNGTTNPLKSVLQYDLITEKHIKKWKSVTEAANNGYTLSSISQCCNGKRKSHRGVGWKFI